MTDNNQARTTAVDFATAQEGKPYSFGAAGPHSWDCSGLTMKSWAAAGFTLPHYTVAQFASVQKVPIAQAQPGDLVFFGGDNPAAGKPHHVGLYIGPGLMIDAPDYGIPVGVHNYNSYGDVMDVVGRMPVGGLDMSPASVTTSPVGIVSGTADALHSVDSFASGLMNPGLWKRIGLGVIGVVLLLLLAKWVG